MTGFGRCRRHCRVLAVERCGSIERRSCRRRLVVTCVVRVREGITEVQASAATFGQKTSIKRLREDDREAVAVRAATIGQLDVVVPASAEAICCQSSVDRRRAAVVLQDGVTACLGRIDCGIDWTAIDGEATISPDIGCLRQINEVQRIVEPRIDVIEVQTPVAEEAGFGTEFGRETEVGTHHSRHVKIWSSRLNVRAALFGSRNTCVDRTCWNTSEGTASDHVDLAGCRVDRQFGCVTIEGVPICAREAVVRERVRVIYHRIAAREDADTTSQTAIREEAFIFKLVARRNTREKDRVETTERVGIGEAITL